MKYSLLDKFQVALFVLFTPNFWAVLIFSAVVLYVFCGCHTTLYYPNGKPRMMTYADARNIKLDREGNFSADVLTHSTHTKRTFDGITETVTAVGGAATALGLTPGVR